MSNDLKLKTTQNPYYEFPAPKIDKKQSLNESKILSSRSSLSGTPLQPIIEFGSKLSRVKSQID
jgi:hypothetical protein